LNYYPDRPLMVQSDFTVLLETEHRDFAEVRGFLGQFADLLKTPKHLHTYRITSLSLWNAASSGIDGEAIVGLLRAYNKFDLPGNVVDYITHSMRRYGLIRLESSGDRLYLTSEEAGVLQSISEWPGIREYILHKTVAGRLEILPIHRGVVKQELIRRGYPVEDAAGYHAGEPLEIRLRQGDPHSLGSGTGFTLRQYQKEAVHAFYHGRRDEAGNGVVVLPCGAGKTIIGIAAMAESQCATLILTTNVTSVRQWRKELLDKTELSEEDIGEYTGDCKEVRPVTIATYQILTYRRAKDDEFVHMELFKRRDWGLIIYDEVHLLPAPVFRATADIQATRRLGLTATLVREDGREEDVFSLVGPKRYEASWKVLEQQGYISQVECIEFRVPMDAELRSQYALEESRGQIRIAGENPRKLDVIRRLILRHSNEPTLVIGQYLDQLRRISSELDAPLISGEMPHSERDMLYQRFRQGDIPLLVVSKVANFAVDLPEARVAIQVSGSFGSRQEEAQRLGRILRPKKEQNRSFFYSLVSQESKEQDYSMNRQLFLAEQGYQYRIEHAEYAKEGILP
jgi:DNA excision repair protein ERCC-3